jgi:hypothetical protein
MTAKSSVGALLLLVLACCAACAGKPAPSSTPDLIQPLAPGTTAQLACPATRPQHSAYPAGPSSVMVPGTPTGALVCRFNGLNGAPRLGLARSATLTGPALAQLVSALNGLHGSMPSGPINCPMDDGATDTVLFHYADATSPVQVSIALTGCAAASNGTLGVPFIGAMADPGNGITAQLAGLVGTATPGR